MTRITVIIPDYNQSGFVTEAIASVLNQSRPADEIIVIDDGSTDDSRDVVTRFDDSVRYLWQENKGLAGARNTGIESATGDLIGLLDADDTWAPDYLEVMVRLADENPGADVLYCMARCMDIHGNDLPQLVGGPPIDPQMLYHELLRQNFIIPSTVLFRKKTVVEAGLFDAALRSCEDWDLWLRLLPGRKLIGSPRSLVRYRVHGNSLSTNVAGMHAATKSVVEKHFGMDDGDPSSWTPEKRRAYGGVYRYQCITFVQRQKNWEACLPLMRKAMLADPSLALDLDFFYELVLGDQLVGYRGVSKIQGFDENVSRLQGLVHDAADSLSDGSVRNQALGTAYCALGLAAYDLGPRPRFRYYFGRALRHRPELVLNMSLVAKFVKSFLSRGTLESFKRLVWRSS